MTCFLPVRPKDSQGVVEILENPNQVLSVGLLHGDWRRGLETGFEHLANRFFLILMTMTSMESRTYYLSMESPSHV